MSPFGSGEFPFREALSLRFFLQADRRPDTRESEAGLMIRPVFVENQGATKAFVVGEPATCSGEEWPQHRSVTRAGD
ncbi:hypothetical protein JW848_02495 [Candidatus Bipolaricaulota bacterium]|nr:hypothetical protein [Candidatus Bipolaricaulota bacterium]